MNSRMVALLSAIAVLIVALSAATLLLSQTTESQTPGISPMTFLSSAALESSKVALTRPSDEERQDAELKTPRDRAEAVAIAGWPAARVVEAELMRVEDQLSDPPFRCLCWVVVIDSPDPVHVGQPSNNGAESPPEVYVPESSFRFALIDAGTGEYLYGVEGTVGRAEPVVPPAP